MRIGYASCNGFSDFKLLTSTPQPYVMWDKLAAEHATHPFSLLLMGAIRSMPTPLDHGAQPQGLERAGHGGEGQTQGHSHHGGAARSLLLRSLLQAVGRPEVARLLARIPSAMMWDDHDIFDGWGSYPESPDNLQGCDVYRVIYAAASRYFRLFQLRSIANVSCWIRSSWATTPGG